MAKGIRCIDKRYMSTIVRDLHLDSHEQYRAIHRTGVFGGWMPSNLYNYIKVVGLFKSADFVSLDTFINIWNHLRSIELLKDFQERHPEFIPSDWENYYGITVDDLHDVRDLFPELDMAKIIEKIHSDAVPVNSEVSEDAQELYEDSDPKEFFKEDSSTYKKVVENILDHDQKNFPLRSILGPNEKWKYSSIRKYLILDGIASDSNDSDQEVEIIASMNKIKFIMGLLNCESHPIYRGLEGYFTFDKHEDRLAEHHRVMDAADEIFNVHQEEDKVEDTFTDEFFNDLALELDKESEPTKMGEVIEDTLPNEWEIHLKGLTILIPKDGDKKITIDGNKIIIQ
jgi:hypothetical protein